MERINKSHISKYYSGTIPNYEIKKDYKGILKLEEEDLNEIIHLFELNHSFLLEEKLKKKFLENKKEFNPLRNFYHKNYFSYSKFTYQQWLKLLEVDINLIDSLNYQHNFFELKWPEKLEVIKHHTNLYSTICKPNIQGPYGFRRIELHKESGQPAIHYKRTLNKAGIAWSENFNLDLTPYHSTLLRQSESELLSESFSSSSTPPNNSNTSSSSTLLTHYKKEPLRPVPTALKTLIHERSHILNISDGTFYLHTGKSVYPSELSNGEHVLRLASSHIYVEDVSKDLLFSKKRKRDFEINLEDNKLTTNTTSINTTNTPHIALVDEIDSEDENNEQEIEKEIEIEKEKEKEKEKDIEININNDNLNDDHNNTKKKKISQENNSINNEILTEDDLHDLLGCSQV